MKKILFSLMALVCSMSMNAQVMKVMKGETVVETYPVAQADNVVFEEGAPAAPAGTSGTATITKITGNINVKWVQLWANGPKFAEYNVGAENEYNKAWCYGGYYTWGGSIDQDPEWDPESKKIIRYYDGEGDLPEAYDTATKLWGSNWRMPTKEEFEALIDNNNCDVQFITDYKGTGVDGYIITGKGDYASNSLFFPASGGYVYDGRVGVQGYVILNKGGYNQYYQSSTSNGSGKSYYLFMSASKNGDVVTARTPSVKAYDNFITQGRPVRAVLAE